MTGVDSMRHYAYGYLIGALFYMLLWTVIFWRRPDLRREMLVMSALSIAYGLPHEYFLWTRDWWHPPTITGTRIGLEDLLWYLYTGALWGTYYKLLAGYRVAPRMSTVTIGPAQLAGT